MIWLIIVISLVLLPILYFVIKGFEDSAAGGIALACIIIFPIILFGCIVDIVNSNFAMPSKTEYENIVYERDIIEYRIENAEDNVIGNELLYSDIVDFNNGLRMKKARLDSKWTNWFENYRIKNIDYIEIW